MPSRNHESLVVNDQSCSILILGELPRYAHLISRVEFKFAFRLRPVIPVERGSEIERVARMWPIGKVDISVPSSGIL